jgi:hypothetical protein
VPLATAIVLLVIAGVWIATEYRRRPTPRPETETAGNGDGQVAAPLPADSPPPPTWMAYRQALCGAEGELDQLLDIHADTLLPQTANHVTAWKSP